MVQHLLKEKGVVQIPPRFNNLSICYIAYAVKWSFRKPADAIKNRISIAGFGLFHLMRGKTENRGQLTRAITLWFGCSTQEYEYSPASVKVCSNVEFGEIIPEPNCPSAVTFDLIWQYGVLSLWDLVLSMHADISSIYYGVCGCMLLSWILRCRHCTRHLSYGLWRLEWSVWSDL